MIAPATNDPTTTAIGTRANVVEILQARAAADPDRAGYTFLADGTRESGALTFGALDRQARAIAGRLQRTARPGDRALLVYPSQLEYVSAFFGCLYAGVVAVPAHPPRGSGRLDRLRAIAADCGVSTVLSTGEVRRQLGVRTRELHAAGAVEEIDTDDIDAWSADAFEPEWGIAPAARGLAFIQYTSGSTSSPKGVMVSHANLLENQRALVEAYGQGEGSVLVSWLPLHHDMGLMGAVVATAYAGGRCILMSPTACVQQPVRWLEAISRYRASVSGGPNFAYDLCVRKISDEQRAGLSLDCWKVAVSGAEPVRPATLRAFAEKFGPCGFRPEIVRPCYGLAESTLIVSWGGTGGEAIHTFDAAALAENRVAPATLGAPQGRELVSCGRGPSTQRIAVVDPDTRCELPPGRVGEVWVAGASVAGGYWGREEATRDTFAAVLADSGVGPFLRTGDLGFVHEDDLFITGRLKDLVIVNGANHYPQDIELTVERSHEAIAAGGVAAFSVETGGQERLVVVAEVQRAHLRGVDPAAVTAAVRAAIAAEHELEVHRVALVKPTSVPKTSSGKVQRRLCRERLLAGALPTVGDAPSAAVSREPVPMAFSLFYFSSDAAGDRGDMYRLLLEGARYADAHGFEAVWIPERHFHPFGGIFPNPSVLAAAVAALTSRIRIRAGSVVLPLHHPLRVAEEWAVVDNLSQGRVDLAFARGWNPNDFVLAPGNFASSVEVLYRNLQTVQALWRGEAVSFPNGKGEERPVAVFPRPRQAEVPVWITCSGGVERFVEAGEGGWNVLTALLFQSADELGEKIAAYRAARARRGHAPEAGRVTVMLHTFLGTDAQEVERTVREPFTRYLESSVDLWRQGSQSLADLGETERRELLEFAFARYYRASGLFGTPESCLDLVSRLQRAGVDEIACLVDFGVETEKALEGLASLHSLQQLARGPARSGAAQAFQPEAAREVDGPDSRALREWIGRVVTGEIARVMKLAPDAVAASPHFLDLGVDSLKAIEIASAIEGRLGVELHPTLLFECPTVESLAASIESRHREGVLAAAGSKG